MKLKKLQIQKVCQDIMIYNDLEINEDWLVRNNFKNISIQNKPYNQNEYEKIIVLNNDDKEILLKSEAEVDDFFNKNK